MKAQPHHTELALVYSLPISHNIEGNVKRYVDYDNDNTNGGDPNTNNVNGRLESHKEKMGQSSVWKKKSYENENVRN